MRKKVALIIIRGLCWMGVELFEFEFAIDYEQDGSDGRQQAIASGFAFGSLEKDMERFEETVGHAASRPSDNSLHGMTDHLGNGVHWLDLRTHHARAPLLEHGADSIDLHAAKDFTQVFPVSPDACRALGA